MSAIHCFARFASLNLGFAHGPPGVRVITTVVAASEVEMTYMAAFNEVHDKEGTATDHCFLVVLDRVSRISQLFSTPRVPCDILYLVPMHIGC